MPPRLAARSRVPETVFPWALKEQVISKVHTNILKFLLPAPEKPCATKQYTLLE